MDDSTPKSGDSKLSFQYHKIPDYKDKEFLFNILLSPRAQDSIVPRIIKAIPSITNCLQSLEEAEAQDIVPRQMVDNFLRLHEEGHQLEKVEKMSLTVLHYGNDLHLTSTDCEKYKRSIILGFASKIDKLISTLDDSEYLHGVHCFSEATTPSSTPGRGGDHAEEYAGSSGVSPTSLSRRREGGIELSRTLLQTPVNVPQSAETTTESSYSQSHVGKGFDDSTGTLLQSFPSIQLTPYNDKDRSFDESVLQSAESTPIPPKSEHDRSLVDDISEVTPGTRSSDGDVSATWSSSTLSENKTSPDSVATPVTTTTHSKDSEAKKKRDDENLPMPFELHKETPSSHLSSSPKRTDREGVVKNIIPAKPICLIISPTKDSAREIWLDCMRICFNTKVKCAVLNTSSKDKEKQFKHIRRRCHILVCTPTKLMDSLENGFIDFHHTSLVVLHQADRLFHLGHAERLDTILNHPDIPKPPVSQRQIVTLSSESQLKELFRDVKGLHRADNSTQITMSYGIPKTGSFEQRVFPFSNDRSTQMNLLKDILHKANEEGRSKCIIFANYKHSLSDIEDELNKLGLYRIAIVGSKTKDQSRIPILAQPTSPEPIVEEEVEIGTKATIGSELRTGTESEGKESNSVTADLGSVLAAEEMAAERSSMSGRAYAQLTESSSVQLFEKGLVDVLLTTDATLAGLGVRANHVVHFDLPKSTKFGLFPEFYFSRIGHLEPKPSPAGTQSLSSAMFCTDQPPRGDWAVAQDLMDIYKQTSIVCPSFLTKTRKEFLTRNPVAYSQQEHGMPVLGKDEPLTINELSVDSPRQSTKPKSSMSVTERPASQPTPSPPVAAAPSQLQRGQSMSYAKALGGATAAATAVAATTTAPPPSTPIITSRGTEGRSSYRTPILPTSRGSRQTERTEGAERYQYPDPRAAGPGRESYTYQQQQQQQQHVQQLQQQFQQQQMHRMHAMSPAIGDHHQTMSPTESGWIDTPHHTNYIVSPVVTPNLPYAFDSSSSYGNQSMIYGGQQVDSSLSSSSSMGSSGYRSRGRPPQPNSSIPPFQATSAQEPVKPHSEEATKDKTDTAAPHLQEIQFMVTPSGLSIPITEYNEARLLTMTQAYQGRNRYPQMEGGYPYVMDSMGNWHYAEQYQHAYYQQMGEHMPYHRQMQPAFGTPYPEMHGSQRYGGGGGGGVYAPAGSGAGRYGPSSYHSSPVGRGYGQRGGKEGDRYGQHLPRTSPFHPRSSPPSSLSTTPTTPSGPQQQQQQTSSPVPNTYRLHREELVQSGDSAETAPDQMESTAHPGHAFTPNPYSPRRASHP